MINTGRWRRNKKGANQRDTGIREIMTGKKGKGNKEEKRTWEKRSKMRKDKRNDKGWESRAGEELMEIIGEQLEQRKNGKEKKEGEDGEKVVEEKS